MSKPVKICQVASGSSITELRGMLEPYGNYDLSYECDDETDFILGWSVSTMEDTFKFTDRYPKAKLICYNWDVYEWVWTKPREGEYDYKKYGDLLARSIEVWCPSDCTVKRMNEWYGLSNGVTIKTAIPVYDAEVADDGYILNALRRLPDRNLDLFEKAASELGLPYESTNHEFTLEEFIQKMARCKFNVVPYYENSTGGLSLIQTYYLGKPSLISNSPYQAANEYMGDRATKFQWNDYEDLKKKLAEMYENPPKVDRKEAALWIQKKYSKLAMGKRIHDRLQKLQGRSMQDNSGQ